MTVARRALALPILLAGGLLAAAAVVGAFGGALYLGYLSVSKLISDGDVTAMLGYGTAAAVIGQAILLLAPVGLAAWAGGRRLWNGEPLRTSPNDGLGRAARRALADEADEAALRAAWAAYDEAERQP